MLSIHVHRVHDLYPQLRMQVRYEAQSITEPIQARFDKIRQILIILLIILLFY